MKGWQELPIVHSTLYLLPLHWRGLASQLCPSWLLDLLNS